MRRPTVELDDRKEECAGFWEVLQIGLNWVECMCTDQFLS